MVKPVIDCEIDSTLVNVLMLFSFILGFLLFRKIRGKKQVSNLKLLEINEEKEISDFMQ